MKHILSGITLALATLAAEGQSKNQLQKALFAEEVERDGSKAAAIYQSMIDESKESPRYLAMARFRLAGIHQSAGRTAEATALLKALAADPDSPADWVVLANRLVKGEQEAQPTPAVGQAQGVFPLLKDKLWYWHSGNGEPYGALRFLPDGKIETTIGIDWVTGWIPMGPNRVRLNQVAGKFWVMDLSEDGKQTTGISYPGAVDSYKFLRLHPAPSSSIQEADIEFIKKLLEKQPDAIASWKIPCKLARLNRTKALAFLSDHGTDVDLRETDSFNYTPLMYAVQYGEIETVRFLLDRGAKVNALDRRGLTPLILAAGKGQSDMISLLLDRGAEIGISSTGTIEKDRRIEIGTALHRAIQQGNLDAAKLLLQRGADINAVTQVKQQTPLVSAMALKYYTEVAELLAAGADPNLPASGIENPLRQAAYQGELAVLRLLLSKGAKPDIQSDADFNPSGLTRSVGSSIEIAAREGHLHVVGALIDAGCLVDHTTPRYLETPLHAAALSGNTSMCRWLLGKGANLNHRLADNIDSQSGWQPLHSATWRESPEVVKLLLEKGASPSDAAYDAAQKRTPFHLAVLKGNLTIAKLMMDRVVASGPAKLAELLAQSDSKGNTALHLAVTREAKPNAGLVRLLIDSGASTASANQRNLTPRQLCLDPESGSPDAAVRATFGK